MSVLMWVAAAWLATTMTIILVFYGTRYSRRLASLMFGLPVSTNVHALGSAREAREREAITRIAA